jgi:hypothetical protein
MRFWESLSPFGGVLVEAGGQAASSARWAPVVTFWFTNSLMPTAPSAAAFANTCDRSLNDVVRQDKDAACALRGR